MNELSAAPEKPGDHKESKTMYLQMHPPNFLTHHQVHRIHMLLVTWATFMGLLGNKLKQQKGIEKYLCTRKQVRLRGLINDRARNVPA